MARLNFPTNFLLQRELFKAILAKDTIDGAGSAVRPFLTEETIVLATDATAGTDADTHEKNRAQASRDAETEREKRDKLFDPVISHLRMAIQFLKKLYRKTPHKLGDWGVTVGGTGKITLPPSFLDQIILFDNFKTKHASFAVGTSPLTTFLTENDIDLNNDDTDKGNAKTAHQNFTTNNAQAESEKINRDNKWNPVTDHLRGIGGFLMNLYSTNPKKAGDWGFIVDDSPRKAVLRNGKVLPESKKAISGIEIGSSVHNTGEVALKIYKGKDTGSTPAVIQPNDEFGIAKGFSTITISNENTTKTGLFSYTVNR